MADPNAPSSSGGRASLSAIGTSGLARYGGRVYEEWLPELSQERGRKTIREMMDNDPTIGALLFAIEMLIRQMEWDVRPGDTSPEAHEDAIFIEDCLNDMQYSWAETVSDILTFLPYGWSYHEIVYRPRTFETGSKYDDGKVGWKGWPIRGQETLLRWEYDPQQVDLLLGMTQLGPPDWQVHFIPVEKAIHFRTSARKNNPEGRPLTLDTAIRTPRGWTTMGEIAVGDQVFDECGIARNVTGKTDVFPDQDIFEITFTTGAVIRADGRHLWSVTTHNDRFNGKPSRTMTTVEMVEMLAKGTPCHLCCGVAPVLQTAHVDLPLDPYLLGYWLGDGKTDGALISCHPNDYPNLRDQLSSAGYSSHHAQQFNVRITGGFLAALRAAGVLHNKHIPALYLTADPDQRLALLQGLMDSDGFSPGRQQDEASTFGNTNTRLIADTAELIRTLGGQPRQRVMEEAGSVGGTVRGRPIIATRTMYELRFMLSLPVHRLPRKLAKQNIRTTMRIGGHFIRSIYPAGQADTVCIEVDSPSHLFLAGDAMVPTHNTILRNAYRPWYFKKHIETIEGIGVDRDLAGMPIAFVPPELLLPTASADDQLTLANIKAIVTGVKKDEMDGIVWPMAYDDLGHPMYDFKLLTTGGQRQIDTDTIISRYDYRILMCVLADFIMLGQQRVGSHALAQNKSKMFFTAIGAWADLICEVINNGPIPDLLRLNGRLSINPPMLVHNDAERTDLESLGKYMLELAQAGAQLDMSAGSTLTRYLLEQANLPAPPDPNLVGDVGEQGEQVHPTDNIPSTSTLPTATPPIIRTIQLQGPGSSPSATGKPAAKPFVPSPRKGQVGATRAGGRGTTIKGG